MNLKIIKTVIAREYLTRVKKKSFLVTTFLVPVLMAGAMIGMIYMMSGMKERARNAAVIDNSGIVMPYLESNDRVTFEDFTGFNPDSLKNSLEEFGKDVLVIVSPLDSVSRNVSIQAYSKDPLGVDFSAGLSSRAEDAVEKYRIDGYGIENLSQIMKDVKAEVKVTEYTMDDKGNESISESGIYMIISMVLGVIIFMFITMFGSMVMSSVIEEKSSRVVEVLISSVRTIDLMFGKIIGVALVALTQFLLWIVLSIVLVLAATPFIGKDAIKDFSKPEIMAQMGVPADELSVIGIDAADIQDTSLVAAVDSTAVTAGPDEKTVILNTLFNIPWAKLIICFLIFFILGYLLYASLFAAVGSAVENEGDASQLQLPITIPLMLAYFVILVAFQNPESKLVVWTSMIPFTSPIVMLARIPYGVPMWQLVASIALLVVTFFACAWVSAKIYKVGILMFGKKSTFKDLWKWLKQ